MFDVREELRIVWMDPKRLRPYGRVCKAHPAAQVRRIAESLAAFGFDQPIVADADGVVLKGHARRMAALRLGLGRVPVLLRRLPPDAARALRIADNKCAESDWHWRALAMELSGLGTAGAALAGYGPDALERLLADVPEVVFTEYDERIAAESLRCPRCGARFDG